MSLPSACTYLPPRKKICTHPCKVVTRKNKPQCRTKYLRNKKKKRTFKKRTRRTKSFGVSDATISPPPEVPSPVVSARPSDPLKTMMDNMFSQQKPI